MKNVGWFVTEKIGMGIINPRAFRPPIVNLYIDILTRGYKMVEARYDGDDFVVVLEAPINAFQGNADVRPYRKKYTLISEEQT